MARRICTLLRDANLRRYLSASLQNRVARICPWDGYVRRMTERLLGSGPATAARDADAQLPKHPAILSDQPTVSVVIPFYNHGRFIGEAIDSILHQTCPAHEIIVIDDGSRHDDAAVAAEAVKRLPNARFISRPNKGAHATINEGCALATGEFVTILNSDDTYHPNRFEQLITAAKLQPSIGLFASEVSFIDETGGDIGEGEWYRNGWDQCDRDVPLWLALLNANFLITTSNLFFRARFLKEVGEFRNFRYAHDLDMLQRSLFRGEIGLIRSRLVNYRFHFGNTIRQDLQGARLEIAQIVAEAWHNRIAIDEGEAASHASAIAKLIHAQGLQAAYTVFAKALPQRAVGSGDYVQIKSASVAAKAAQALAEFDEMVKKAQGELGTEPKNALLGVVERGGRVPEAALVIAAHDALQAPRRGQKETDHQAAE
jgi:glycosyltransferase involved in cell wall biosynthesis